ncbi:putative leucine-rich repeat-containing protein DDB_G0290503 isoform X2 [Centruroides vittatus]|uniref:putative leucine-rich repeat-containing protein DDB_G0290503 isoform X2 n=1 Tax=Centruroides vittatus TaxID=120091 RepID=UPI00350ED000
MAVQKILKEVTETVTDISDEDVTIYAQQLGIDVLNEKHLFWIARKGLETPLPKPWCPVEDEKGRIYYYNYETDNSSWEHPADSYFREIVKQERERQASNKQFTNTSIDCETSHTLYPKKNVLPEISNKRRLKFMSSLEDIPPIKSGRNTISALTDDKNMSDQNISKKSTLSTEMQENKGNEKQITVSYLKGKNEILLDDSIIMEKDRNFIMKLQTDDSLKQETDEDLSTGLDVGFDRFALQFGLMDASDLSPMMASPEIEKKESSNHNSNLDSTPKSLLKNLFDASFDINDDKNSMEIKSTDGERFFNFLKEVEELNEKSSEKENSYLINKSKEETEESENEINSINDEISDPKELSKTDRNIHNDFEKDYKEYDQKLQEMEEIWKKELIEKEKVLRLEYEDYINQLQNKLLEEKELQEAKINEEIESLKKENAEVLAKQEQIFTEELESELESVKVEMELKKLSALNELRRKMEKENEESLTVLKGELEEKYSKEFKEKEENLIKLYDEKEKDMVAEMEKNLEDKRQNIQTLHQQEIENLIQKNTLELGEVKCQQNEDNLELLNEIKIAKNELQNIQKSIQVETETLKELENNRKNVLEKYQEEELEINNCLQKLKNDYQDKAKEKTELDEQLHSLQNNISEIKTSIEKEEKILIDLISEKKGLQNELTILKGDLNKYQEIQLLQEKSVSNVDKCVDTYELFYDKGDKTTENIEYKIDEYLSKESPNENHSLNEHEDIKEMQSSFIEKESKVEQLALKMDTLEKAFKLLEMKIENSIDSTLTQNERNYNENTNVDDNLKCNFPISLLSNKDERQKNFSKSQNTTEKSNHYINDDIISPHDVKQSVMLVSNDGNINNSYQNFDLTDKGTSPVYISTSEIHLVPYKKVDFNSQLKDYRKKLNNIQSKYNTSKVKLDLIKEDILNDISEKLMHKENLYKNNEQSSDNQSRMENAYEQNMLPTAASNIDFITHPARIIQNNKWNSDLRERAQQFIQKEAYFKHENNYSSENNLINEPLNQFFTLTDAVLDKELGLFSKKKSKRHYMSCPTLIENYSTVSSSSSESLDFSDDYKKCVPSRKQNDVKSVLLSKASSLGKIINEKEDWTEKIETLYHKIRESERDLILHRSVKANF